MLPTRMRLRRRSRVARGITRAAYPGSRVGYRLHRGRRSHRDPRSIFCQVRETADRPLCGFYAGVVVKLMALYGLGGHGPAGEMPAAGGKVCDAGHIWEPGDTFGETAG